MASSARQQANRENAKKSTGPKSQRGKAIAARNAARHGLLAREPVLPGESPDEYARLRAELMNDLAPVGALEVELVDRLALLAWRLRRIGRVEAGLLVTHDLERRRAEALADARGQEEAFLSSLGRVVLDAERHEAALRDADQWRCAAEQSLSMLARAFIGLQGAFTTLSRYESTLDARFLRTLHELQRLQAARAGRPVTVPAALDVTVVADCETKPMDAAPRRLPLTTGEHQSLERSSSHPVDTP